MSGGTADAPAARPGGCPWWWKGTPVPYVTRWSGEYDDVDHRLRLNSRGLYYRDEDPSDRDHRGALWARVEGAYGDGVPVFRAVHSERQRTAMEDLRCQVCGGHASRTSAGVLFLLEGPGAGAAELEGHRTGQPPLCLPCARLARRHCPRLRPCVALRVRKPTRWGVWGQEYLPFGRVLLPTGRLTPQPKECPVAYGTRDVRAVVAHQLVLELRRITRIDLGRELAAAH